MVVSYLEKSKVLAFQNKQDSAIFYLQKAKLQALGNPVMLFRVYNRCAGYYFKEEIKLDSARVYLKKMQALLPDIENQVLKARVYNKTGYLYQLDGETAKAFQAYQKAIEMNSENGEFIHANVLAMSHIRMARLYAKLGLYTYAQNFAKKAMNLIESSERVDTVFVYMHVGWMYKKMKNFDDALSYLQKAAQLNKKKNEKSKRARYTMFIKKNLAEISYEKGNKQKALSLALESIEMSKKAKLKNLDGSLNLLLSKIYADQGDVKLAKQYAHMSFEIATLKDIPGKILMRAKHLQRLYKNEGNTKQALYFSEIYIEVKKRVDKEEGKIAIIKQEYLESAQKNKEKLQEIHAKSELNMLLITGALLVSVGFGFAFYRRRKTHFLQQIAKKEKAKYRMQQKLKVVKEQAIEKEAALKIYMEMLSEDAVTNVKNAKEVEKILNDLRDFKILTERDWTGFKSIFQNIYPEFFKNFKVKTIQYSQGDLKLAALIRLSFNTKEIADILVISPDSVRKSKYRLRKKMSFASEKQLQNFIYDL
ncbi:tetratricopeptide repeat protein [Kordia sp.]|uniref:tetratricopeptide repeat protein n=1 Tax=Kordia sp. TaxID=1965332 RepID=UPI00386B5A63